MTNPYQNPPVPYPVDRPEEAAGPSNRAAVTAFLLGILTVVLGMWIPLSPAGSVMIGVAFLPAVLSIIFGHVGVRTAARIGVGRGAALTGLIIGYGIILLSIATILWWLHALSTMYDTGAVGA